MNKQPKPASAYTSADLRVMADRITERTNRAIFLPAGETAIYAEALRALAEMLEKEKAR